MSIFLASWLPVSYAAEKSAKNTTDGSHDKIKEKEKQLEELNKQKETLRKQLQEITQQYQESYTKFILIKERVQRNKQKLGEYSIDLDLNQEQLDKRVVSMYKNREDLAILSLLLNFKSFQSLVSDFQFMQMISKADVYLIEKTRSLKKKIEEKQAVLEEEKNKQQKALEEVKIKKEDMKRNLDAQNMLQKLLSEDVIRLRKQTAVIDGLELSIIFPVDGFHSYINDWGFPRSSGRRHRGNDIFAKKGTPVVAVTDGVIGKASPVEVGLGGITLWLYGYDNVHYYYAHLEKIADGIKLGSEVSAGQVIGYVGNTGNARTTPPHLHFQIHPGGGEPINPFPFLEEVCPYK